MMGGQLTVTSEVGKGLHLHGRAAHLHGKEDDLLPGVALTDGPSAGREGHGQ